jgi:hypothetical protein
MSNILSKFALNKLDFSKPSVLALVAANIIPLFGVLFLGWSTFAIVVIYWSENVIIGAINVLKMIVCAPNSEAIKLSLATKDQLKGNSKLVQEMLAKQVAKMPGAHHASKIFFIPFFIVHYGMFCFVHGMFIFELLADGVPFDAGGPFSFTLHVLSRLWQDQLIWAVLALAVSHLFSFFSNFLYRGEYHRVTVLQLMFQPYGRIVILHVAILFGAFLIMAFGSPVWMLVILIIGKTIMDIGLHLLQREQDAQEQQPPPILTTT